MMMRSAFLALALTFAVAAPAMAQDRWRPDFGQKLTADDARDNVREGRIKPLEEIVDIVRGQMGGQLRKAELADRGGRKVYVLRWQTDDGRLLFLEVDAQTGQILR
jgi:uncharacterized membrane protein YkoI